jgi:hypothetical protein
MLIVVLSGDNDVIRNIKKIVPTIVPVMCN